MNESRPITTANVPYVFEAIRRTRRALPREIPLLGFAGAPFTLASYMIEGGGSTHYVKTKSFFMKDPGGWHALLEKLSRLTVSYLNAQIAAGAQAVPGRRVPARPRRSSSPPNRRAPQRAAGIPSRTARSCAPAVARRPP